MTDIYLQNSYYDTSAAPPQLEQYDTFVLTDYIDLEHNEHARFIFEYDPDMRKQLMQTAIHSFITGEDTTTAHIRTNAIVGNYYQKVIVPMEDAAIAQCRHEEQERITNNVPDFSNVYVGQQWFGKSRMAEFIRAVKLVPKPSGKNTRVSQEKTIRQFCDLVDDKDCQILTLQEIYDEIKPRERKENKKKYEPYIALLLLERLMSRPDRILRTTKADFFRQIYAISWNYKRVPIDFYCGIINIDTDEKFYTEEEKKVVLRKCLHIYHDLAGNRLKEILDPVLEDLVKKSVIKTSQYPVAVIKDKLGEEIHITSYNQQNYNYEDGEIERMMMRAEQYAASQITCNVENPITKLKEYRSLRNVREVMVCCKEREYRSIYDEYIKECYGWERTYTALEIVLTDNEKYLELIIHETIREAATILNSLIVDALSSTIDKKVENNSKKVLNRKIQLLHQKLQEPEYKSIKEDYEDCGFWTEEELANIVTSDYETRIAVYPKILKNAARTFMDYEIKFDREASSTLTKWKDEHPIKADKAVNNA